MKRFVFRLQTALEHRRHLEEQRRAELACVQERLRGEAERLQHLTDQRDTSLRLAQAERMGHVSPEIAEARERFLGRLETEITQQKTVVELVQREVQSKVREVVAATQETQALENLRVRHLQEYKVEEQREEQKFLDDIASIRAAGASRERSDTID